MKDKKNKNKKWNKKEKSQIWKKNIDPKEALHNLSKIKVEKEVVYEEQWEIGA